MVGDAILYNMKLLGIYLKSTLMCLLVLLTASVARADGVVSFEINTPLMVQQGEPFRIEFILENAQPDENSYSAPAFEGLDVMAGPTIATGSSFSFINGVESRKTTYTFTYVMMASGAGNIEIGEAALTVDGKRYATKKTTIEVVAAQEGGSTANEHGSSVQRQLAKDDILLRMNISRGSVYKGEPVRASLVIYTRASIANIEDFKLPSFDGFWSQELPISQQNSSRENINDKVYEAYVLKEYLLYPQKSGELVIEPTTLTAVAQVVVKNNRYDPFFGRGADVYDVPRSLSTGAVKINVKELPEGAPASFTGAVGEFTLSSEVPSVEMKANSAATYTVKISGSGNLNFLQQPELMLPSSFELYDVRRSEQINTTATGLSGWKQFEYPFIVRSEGEYNIDGVAFTYFNPQSGEYVTLQGKPLSLNIQPDKSGASAPAQVVTIASKEEVAELGSDIRFIKLGSARLTSVASPLMMSQSYYLVIAVVLLVAIIIYLAVYMHRQSNKNQVVVRNRRANKVAVQRFHTAHKFMKEQKRYEFFSEMSRALWGYISDKLNIPVSDLAKESIREVLKRRGVSEENARHFTDIISRCDEAQYSPAGSVQMEEVYEDGVNIVSHIESVIKR